MEMEENDETTWEQRLNAMTHILTNPTTSPSLHSQLFISTQIPYLPNWQYPPMFGSNSLHWAFGLSLFLKRVFKYGPPDTSWRSKCPYQVPPPLVLAGPLEPAQWSEAHKREALRKRVTRKRLVTKVNPLIPLLVPNGLLLCLLFWDPPLPDI